MRIPYDFYPSLINPCLELLYWLPPRNRITSILSCGNDCLRLFCKQILPIFRAEVQLVNPLCQSPGRTGYLLFPSNQLFQLDKVFYAGIGFLLAFTVFYCISRLLGLFLNLVPTKILDGKYYRIGAGVLSVGVTLFVLQMMLTILATVPLQIVQNSLENSFVARHIIQSIPFTTSLIKQLWVTKLIG